MEKGAKLWPDFVNNHLREYVIDAEIGRGVALTGSIGGFAVVLEFKVFRTAGDGKGVFAIDDMIVCGGDLRTAIIRNNRVGAVGGVP